MPSPSQKRRKLARSISSKSVEFDPIETVSFESPFMSSGRPMSAIAARKAAAAAAALVTPASASNVSSESTSSSGDSSAGRNGSKAQTFSVKSAKKRKPTLSSSSSSTPTLKPSVSTVSSDKSLSAVAARKLAATEVTPPTAAATTSTIPSLSSQPSGILDKVSISSSKKRKIDKTKQASATTSILNSPTSSIVEQIVQISTADHRSQPLSAIAARKAREAALHATSFTLPNTSSPTPIDNTPTPAPEQSNSDKEDQELENYLAFERSPSSLKSFRGFNVSEDIDRPESSVQSSDDQSESDDEEVTLQMDGEVVGLGFSHKSHRRGWDGLKKEQAGEKNPKEEEKKEEDEEEEEDMVLGDESFRAEADGLMDDSLIVEVNAPVETEKEQIINKPFQRYNKPQPSAYRGAMSTFLPALGHNVILLCEDRLRAAFDDVIDGENGVVVLLSENENLIFSGTCVLYPLHASLSLFGTTLSPDSNCHPVHAPTSHPLPVLTPSNPSPSDSAESLIKKLGVDLELIKGFKAAFLVREGKSGLETMGRIVPNFESIWTGDMAGWGVRGFYPILHQSSFTAHSVPPTWHTALERSIPRISSTQKSIRLLSGSDDGQSQEEDNDEQALQPFTALIKGPKRAGKSGFSRLLANRLLSTYRRVAFLETDLGQSEFGPEGSISLVVIEKPLLGPPFAHPAIPFRAHYLGSSSPRHNPTRYLTLIADLLESYRLSIQYPPFQGAFLSDSRNGSVIPLIVNTQGWVKGLGMDLLIRLERMISPNVIYEFDPVDEEDQGWEAAIPAEGGWGRFRPQQDFGEIDLDEDDERRNHSGSDGYGHLGRSSQIKRHLLNSIGVSPIAARYGAVDLRILGLISYFHSRFHKTIDPASLSGEDSGRLASSNLATKWDFSTPLVLQRPWAVDWTKAIERIYMVGSGAEEVATEEIWRALGGCVVALVRTDSLSSPSEPAALSTNSTGFPYESGQPLPSPSATQYLGLAILRSVPSPDAYPSSQASKTIHLLTPLPPDILPTARIIMRGDTELPVSAMLNWKDRTAMEGADGATGLRDLPFLDHKTRSGMDIIGGDRRKIRRNVQRRT